ncbi:MAG: hypothetical protein HF967_08665 [Methanosarcinales archaeon]|nr:hypothetical protein [Methanosarcinales archaeon]
MTKYFVDVPIPIEEIIAFTEAESLGILGFYFREVSLVNDYRIEACFDSLVNDKKITIIFDTNFLTTYYKYTFDEVMDIYIDFYIKAKNFKGEIYASNS